MAYKVNSFDRMVIFCYICKVEVIREMEHKKQLCMTCRDKLRDFNIQTVEKDIPYELWEIMELQLEK